MATMPISEVRQRDHAHGNRTARQAIERASTFALTLHDLALNGTGDHVVGVVPFDCEFIGGYVVVSADEGTNGDLTIEHWDDAAGSAKVTCSLTVAIDAGAASNEPIAVHGTAANNLVTAGYIIMVNLGTGTGNAVTGDFTLFFKTVNDAGEAG